MRRAVLAGALLSGCATGADAVDVNNGGGFRFVAGTPRAEVVPEGERASAPAFSGTLLGGGDFTSAALDGVPSTIVLDREGRVAAVFTAEVQQEDLRSTLDLLLAEG